MLFLLDLSALCMSTDEGCRRLIWPQHFASAHAGSAGLQQEVRADARAGFYGLHALVAAVCKLLQAGRLATHIVRCAPGELYDIINAYQPAAYHEMDAPTLHSTLAVSGRCSALITVSGA